MKTSNRLASMIQYWCVLLLLFMAVTVSRGGAQSAFFDFNTPGQLTNNFGARAKTAATAVWWETNSSGIGNSGALDGITGSALNPTMTYQGDAFPFPLVDGATLNMSILFRGKLAASASV